MLRRKYAKNLLVPPGIIQDLVEEGRWTFPRSRPCQAPTLKKLMVNSLRKVARKLNGSLSLSLFSHTQKGTGSVVRGHRLELATMILIVSKNVKATLKIFVYFRLNKYRILVNFRIFLRHKINYYKLWKTKNTRKIGWRMNKTYVFKEEREMSYSKQKPFKKLLLGKSCWVAHF